MASIQVIDTLLKEGTAENTIAKESGRRQSAVA